MSEWRPIEELPEKGRFGRHFILGHAEKRWIRFGTWYPEQREWYFSGTSERSQWAQVRGDQPTHWMPMPLPPTEAA